MFVCLCIGARPPRLTALLDVAVVAMSAMWIVQYYALATYRFTVPEVYLYNESWMFVCRLLFNIAFGRIQVVVPASLVVSAFDVYALTYLTPDWMSGAVILHNYAGKQAALSVLACAMQLGVQRLAANESEAVFEKEQFEIGERLSRNLIESLCDASVSLDHMFQIVGPAPKFLGMLCRQGATNTQDFMNLVARDSQEELAERMKENARTDEPWVPVHVNFIDVWGSPVRCTVYCSAIPTAADNCTKYVLGINEMEEIIPQVDVTAQPQHEHRSRQGHDQESSFGSIPEHSAAISMSSGSSRSSEEDGQQRAESRDFIHVDADTGEMVACSGRLQRRTGVQEGLARFNELFTDGDEVLNWFDLNVVRIRGGSSAGGADFGTAMFTNGEGGKKRVLLSLRSGGVVREDPSLILRVDVHPDKKRSKKRQTPKQSRHRSSNRESQAAPLVQRDVIISGSGPTSQEAAAFVTRWGEIFSKTICLVFDSDDTHLMSLPDYTEATAPFKGSYGADGTFAVWRSESAPEYSAMVSLNLVAPGAGQQAQEQEEQEEQGVSRAPRRRRRAKNRASL